MELSRFLDRAAATPFEPGVFDCCLWLADWGRELTGLDGAAAWRGAYSDPLGCLRIMGAHGGVARLVRHGATAIGMRRLRAPRAGAVGVVAACLPSGARVHVGGLYTGRRWAILFPGGLAFSESGGLAAWGL